MVGITKFIKTHLQNNKAFSPLPLLTKSKHVKGRHMGLQIGRYTDLLFRRVFEKKVVLNPSNFRHRRCCAIFNALKHHKIKVRRVQVSVKHDELGIETQLDALGVTHSGKTCVIELKTTQYTLAEHELCYKRKCRIQPQLTNGLPNTEHTVHGLQTAFGALALQKTKAYCQTPTVGMVVVAASDGAMVYWVDPAMINVKCFQKIQPKIVPVPTAKRDKKALFSPWPQHQTLQQILDCLQARGYTHAVGNTTGSLQCSGIAYSSKTRPYTAIAVIGIYRNGLNSNLHPAPTKYPLYIQQLRQDANKIYLRHKKKCRVNALLITPTATGAYCVQVVVAPLC